ncbi:hypothetical protein BC829DRAFT_88086 [Chytridium lagenaria]|nr:hypothetical protein BC829DRAFT_88086 [Chytridium lagenaria]
MPKAEKESKGKKEKSTRQPSAYNLFMKTELPRIKKADTTLTIKMHSSLPRPTGRRRVRTRQTKQSEHSSPYPFLTHHQPCNQPPTPHSISYSTHNVV